MCIRDRASTGEVTFGNPGTSLSFVDDTMHMTYINATSGMLEHITQYPAGAAASVVDGDGFTVGLYTSIALDGSGQQHVAYHNASATSLVYARQEGTSWSVEEIDNTASVGYYPSIALDNDGRPHISYVDSGSDYLKYAHYNGSGWEIAIIDDLTNDVFDTSIAVNDTGHPQIAYSIRNYSSSTWEYAVRYASYDGANWSIETPMTRASSLSYSSLDLSLIHI